MGHTLNIVYFAWVRERLGIGQELFQIGDGVETIGDVLTALSDRGDVYADIFADITKLRFALDQDYGLPSSSIGSAKELAIFPPVTGG